MSTLPRRNFKRVILKLSGEALREPGSHDNISPEIVENMAEQIKAAHQTGIEIGLVVGGGNFWRGISASNRGMERATADYMGMLATVMNSLALQSMLEAMDVPTRVQTAIEMKNVAEPFIRRVAMRHLELGRVVIFAAGHRQPVLLHRHHRRAARQRDRCRRDPQGHQGRWGVRLGSGEEPGRHAL